MASVPNLAGQVSTSNKQETTTKQQSFNTTLHELHERFKWVEGLKQTCGTSLAAVVNQNSPAPPEFDQGANIGIEVVVAIHRSSETASAFCKMTTCVTWKFTLAKAGPNSISRPGSVVIPWNWCVKTELCRFAPPLKGEGQNGSRVT